MLLLLVPMPAAAAEETSETTTKDLEDLQADARERIDEVWAEHPAPGTDELADLLVRYHSDELTEDETLTLTQGLRAHEAGEGQGDLDEAVQRALATLMNERGEQAPGTDGDPPAEGPWQEDTWDEYSDPLTAAYLAGATVHPFFLPQDIRLEGLQIFLDLDTGCTGDIMRGYCYVRATADALALASVDMHGTSDTALAQVPLDIEIRAHWECTSTWWGTCVSWRFWTETIEYQDPIATDTAYTFAFPATAGQIATRATDHTIVQEIYDDLGELAFQKAPGVTSARATRTVSDAADAAGAPNPVEAPEEATLPGVSDLHAVSPRPNHYGVQAPPELGLAEAHGDVQSALAEQASLVPGPLQAAFGHLTGTWDDVEVRERSEHGTAPADSLGPTTVFEAHKLVSGYENILIVRWKNVGTGSAGQAEAPASFYYDAGAHDLAGSGNLWTVDYAITQEISTPG